MDQNWWSGNASEPVPAERPFAVADPTAVETVILGHSRAGDGVEPLPRVEGLTEREREILAYVPSMLSAAEIGEELYISVNTVKAHLRSIYRKLGVSRRREAVIQARRHGLL